MAQLTFAEALVKELLEFVGPLRDAAADPARLAGLLEQAGWSLPAMTAGAGGRLTTALSTVATVVGEVEQWRTSPPASLEDLLKVLDAAERMVGVLSNLGTGVSPSDADELEELALDLVDQLTVSYLRRRVPILLELLSLLTLAPVEGKEPVERAGKLARTGLPRRRLRLERISDLLRQPLDTLREVYQPNGLATRAACNVAAERMARRLLALLAALRGSGGNDGPVQFRASFGLDASLDESFDILLLPLAEQERLKGMLTLAATLATEGDGLAVDFGTTLALIPEDEGGPGLALVPFGNVNLSEPIGDIRFSIVLEGAPDGFEVTSHGLSDYSGTGGPFAFSVGLASERPNGDPFLLGVKDSTHIEVSNFDTSFSVSLRGGEVDVGVEASLSDAALVVPPPSGDGFLAQLLPRDGMRAPFAFGIGWSRSGGLHLIGSGSLHVRLAQQLELGPVKLSNLEAALEVSGAGPSLGLTGDLRLRLGPLTATVNGLGIQVDVTFPREGGNLGPARLVPALARPKAIGLALQSEAVTGGGFLLIGVDEYAGMVQIAVKGLPVSLAAIGLLNTRLPDGQPGFSLIVIITATFPPIQLGLGFTLNGIGGLLGIHRTMDTAALREGVRSRALEGILFPTNPVANAVTILGQLRAIFPPALDRFVFGPMVKLGWGPKGLLEIDVALLLELPAPIRLAILGRLRCVLPSKEAGVVFLQLDVAGIIDFGLCEASVDATLVDSRIAAFALTGDMAMRIAWGATKLFALAFGGFNPRFAPPPAFPTLRRLALSLATGDNPRIRLESYLALTSNTLQLGARAEIFASTSTAFGTFSGSAYLGFDTLVTFDPFQFVADLCAAIEISRDGQPFVFGRLAATLTGPGRWHAVGSVELQLLVKVRVGFDVSSGEDPGGQPELVDLTPMLQAEVARPEVWTALAPDLDAAVAQVRGTDPKDGLLLHPLGQLALHQRLLPFNKRLSRFGGALPSQGPVTYRLSGITVDIGGSSGSPASSGTLTPVVDDFAPGQYDDLTDDEKLSRPAFESMEAGARVGLAAWQLPVVPPGAGNVGVLSTLEHSCEVVDDLSQPSPSVIADVPLPAEATVGLRVGATASAGFTADGNRGVAVRPERYVLALASSLQPIVEAGEGSSCAEAHDALRALGIAGAAVVVVTVTEAA
jgi:hypothetical protein